MRNWHHDAPMWTFTGRSYYASNRQRATKIVKRFRKVFGGELAQYLERQQEHGATYLFESNRLQPFSTRRIWQIVKHYAVVAGIEKRVYPHLFRHQLITFDGKALSVPTQLRGPCGGEELGKISGLGLI